MEPVLTDQSHNPLEVLSISISGDKCYKNLQMVFPEPSNQRHYGISNF